MITNISITGRLGGRAPNCRAAQSLDSLLDSYGGEDQAEARRIAEVLRAISNVRPKPAGLRREARATGNDCPRVLETVNLPAISPAAKADISTSLYQVIGYLGDLDSPGPPHEPTPY